MCRWVTDDGYIADVVITMYHSPSSLQPFPSLPALCFFWAIVSLALPCPPMHTTSFPRSSQVSAFYLIDKAGDAGVCFVVHRPPAALRSGALQPPHPHTDAAARVYGGLSQAPGLRPIMKANGTPTVHYRLDENQLSKRLADFLNSAPLQNNAPVDKNTHGEKCTHRPSANPFPYPPYFQHTDHNVTRVFVISQPVSPTQHPHPPPNTTPQKTQQETPPR